LPQALQLQQPAAIGGDRVAALAVLDIIPVSEVWDRADDRLALGLWPRSLLAQPSQLPETILIRCGDAIVADAAANWGSGNAFAAEVQREYAGMLRDAAHAHAICEEYRAAASIDRDHDRQDQAAERKIVCPTLALWSGAGPLSNWYQREGGPLAIWQRWCENVKGRPVEGGHFFPEERPHETAAALSAFLRKPNG
jgi:haloacetate dehalogenase